MKGGAKLAMDVSGQRAVASIAGEHWRAAARAAELPADVIIERIIELGERMPAAIHRVIEHPGGDDETRQPLRNADADEELVFRPLTGRRYCSRLTASDSPSIVIRYRCTAPRAIGTSRKAKGVAKPFDRLSTRI